MRLIIVSGLSGSGKSVALNMLEDLGFYCIDNIPVASLRALVEQLVVTGDPVYERTAFGIDARNRQADISDLPQLVAELRGRGVECDVLFLHADDDVLLKRFGETHRKHPLLVKGKSLREAIRREVELLGPVINIADLTIDTTRSSVYDLRDAIRRRVGDRTPGQLSILVESFGYKHGLPSDADFVFDVRCLPNPYWQPQLRGLDGRDAAVGEYLAAVPMTGELIDDIVAFLEKWIPRYEDVKRTYMTVAIGCTGGQHRSVYLAERVAERLARRHSQILTRHSELPGSAGH
jgi:RNase adapter protein RapZ